MNRASAAALSVASNSSNAPGGQEATDAEASVGAAGLQDGDRPTDGRDDFMFSPYYSLSPR